MAEGDELESDQGNIVRQSVATHWCDKKVSNHHVATTQLAFVLLTCLPWQTEAADATLSSCQFHTIKPYGAIRGRLGLHCGDVNSMAFRWTLRLIVRLPPVIRAQSVK
jgi:hypothetical protein